MGILTVGVVTKPFSFEGKRRAKHAEDAFNTIKGTVDTLIVVPNQKLLENADPKISMLNAFALSNDILKQAIKGISDIITRAGHINVDFADVRTIMKDTGMAIMGTGRASGPDRARQAAMRAISSPLLESASIHGARGVLINITGNEDLELQEINEAASMVYDMVNPEANIIMGSVIDKSLGDEICVTVIATGLEQSVPAIAAPVIITTAQTITPAVIEYVAPASPEPVFILEVAIPEVVTAPTMTMITGATSAAGYTAPIEESFDMDNLDTPTFMRKKAAEQSAQSHDE